MIVISSNLKGGHVDDSNSAGFMYVSNCFLLLLVFFFRISYFFLYCLFFHFVDIEPGIDEKGAARVLEEAITSVIPKDSVCVFTVAHNAFIGLECTELTCYDVIIVTKELPHFAAIDFKNVLNSVGSPTPIVLLIDENDPISDYDVHHLGFFCPLKKPFSMDTLCSVLQRVITRHISSSSNRPPFGSASAGGACVGSSSSTYSHPQQQQQQIEPYNNTQHSSSNRSHSQTTMQLPPQAYHHIFTSSHFHCCLTNGKALSIVIIAIYHTH